MKYALIGAGMTGAMLGGWYLGGAIQALYGVGGAFLMWMWVAGGVCIVLMGKRK